MAGKETNGIRHNEKCSNVSVVFKPNKTLKRRLIGVLVYKKTKVVKLG